MRHLNSFIVVRIRGTVDVKREIKDTLKLLRLPRKFHATIVPNDSTHLGMLFKVKDYVTWGPATPEIVKELLLKRGRIIGNRPVTEEFLVKATGMKSIDEVAKALAEGKLKINKIEGLKPVFRLHPPRGGFKKSTKKSIKQGGELGFREDISSLIRRML